MRVAVHFASIQDCDGAGLVLNKIRRRFPWLELIWADGSYNAWQVDAAVAKVPLLRLEIVKRSDDMKGFVVLPAAGWSSALSPGSGEIAASPRTLRTSPRPWRPSLLSLPKTNPSFGQDPVGVQRLGWSGHRKSRL